MSAPDWTKDISNDLLCGWFYLFFVIRAVIFTVLLLLVLYLLYASSGGIFKGRMGVQLLGASLGLIVAAADALFFYLICDRSLRSAARAE